MRGCENRNSETGDISPVYIDSLPREESELIWEVSLYFQEARLFIRAIILCDNEPFMKLVKGIDFINVRRQMKEVNPALFSEYLKYVENRNQTEL